MIFYALLIFCLLGILGDYKIPGNYTKKQKFIIAGAIIILLTIFRFDLGFDYFNYYRIILSDGGNEYRKEFLSSLICDLGHWAHYPPLSFAVFSLITYSCILYSFSHNSHYSNYCLFFYICFFFLESMGGIRQALAEGVVFAGFTFIREKKLWKYLGICVIGALCHTSALLAVPIYFLYNIKNKKVIIFGIIALCIGMASLSIFISHLGLFGAAANRIASGNADEFGGGSLVRMVFPCLFIGAVIIRYVKKENINPGLFFIVLVGIILPFLIGAHYGGRVARYYNIYLCFIFAEILANYKLIFRNILLFLFSLYFLAFIYVGWNKKRPTIAPYQTIFQIENIDKPKFRLP